MRGENMPDQCTLPRKTRADMHALMQVALGESPADLVVVNARLVNVYTGEVQEKMCVAARGPWIARVSPDSGDVVGPGTTVVDAAGLALIPGLIDSHTHLAWIYTAAEFVPYAVASGTTTVVTETLEPYPVAGVDGVIDFLESLRGQPIKFLATAPAMVSISPAARGISAADLERLLQRDDVIGLGESYWQGVLQQGRAYLPAIETALRAGKIIEGHSAGASEKKLAAYAAAGVTSCHEPINAEQALSRLRAGLHVMAREGGIRRDLAEIAKIMEFKVDLRRLILASDGVSPRDLIDGRYMAQVVQTAIDCGIPPVAAVQMATLTPAEHFRIDDRVGGIAPGRLADLVIIPDPATIRPQTVISNGRVVYRDGRLLQPPRRHRFAEKSLATVRLPRRLTPEDFAIRAPAGAGSRVKARVIAMVTDLVTAERHVDLAPAAGRVEPDPAAGLCKIAAVDRSHRPGGMFTGLIQGFGLTSGAVACSAAWDSSDIVVVGANDADMACAVNRIADLQGGAVFCEDSAVVAEMALPVFGIACELPLPAAAGQLEELKQQLALRGVAFPDPLLSLITLTGAAIPYLRICEEGLVNLKDGRQVALFL
jgi:adenine deaminase